MVIYLFDFFIPRLMPGDPLLYTSSVSGEDMNVEFSKEQLEQMRAYYGLDEPVIKQLISTKIRQIPKITPNSSLITEKIKSDSRTGISNGLPWVRPIPNQPPVPMANRDWHTCAPLPSIMENGSCQTATRTCT